MMLMIVPAGWAVVEAHDERREDYPAEAISYIRHCLQEYPIVCLSEGGHQAREPHQFLRRILGDVTILRTVDVVIVEFANARHQGVLDAYIRGDDVPFSELSKVWRDTSQSPHAPWDSPLYHELLTTIRKGNLGIPADERVRVLAGDPPIDWEIIKTTEDFNRSRIPRDPFVAGLAMEQAFRLGKRILIIYGGAHLSKVPVGSEDDLRNSLTWRILKKHPGKVISIGFLIPENLRVENRIEDLESNRVYPTSDHWVGEIDAELFFPEIYSLVGDETTGRQSWQRVPLYSGYLVRDLFDALVYLGPSREWEHVPAAFDPERDKEYLNELNRRSLARFGRPYVSEQ